MKVSDIMLDLETGDATVHDAYVQEAMGQINVSAAIYEAAKNIASLDPSEMTEVIQEAATNAGLPTDREKAIELMYEAAERQLIGLTRQLYQETCIFAEYASSETSPAAALDMIGKKCGCKVTMNPSAEYCSDFAGKVIGCKDIKTKDVAFISGKSAKKATAAAIKAFCHLMAAAGRDIPESITNNKSIDAVVPALPIAKCKEGKCKVSFMVGNVENANDVLSGVLTNGDVKLEKKTSASRGDIATLMYCWFAIVAISNAITGDFKSTGASIEKDIKAEFKKMNKEKVSGDIEKLNDISAKDVSKNLHTLCKKLRKAINDAFYSIITVKGKED